MIKRKNWSKVIEHIKSESDVTFELDKLWLVLVHRPRQQFSEGASFDGGGALNIISIHYSIARERNDGEHCLKLFNDKYIFRSGPTSIIQ